MEAERQQAFWSLIPWFKHLQKGVADCKYYSVVYGRVAVSTFSLSSSSLMTAVFLASLIFRRPSIPVVMVWTFEHPSLRAVFFLFIFLCDKKVLLSGKEVTICLSVLLILIHLKRKVDHSGTAPHYLGAAQLEAGDSCPMWCEDLFHRWKEPPKTSLYASWAL